MFSFTSVKPRAPEYKWRTQIKIRHYNMTETHARFFSATVLFLHILYLTLFFGVVALNETYVHNFSTVIQFGVCLFLIYRFFPYKTRYVLTRLDVSVIFYCATFLLLNVVSIELYSAFFKGTVVGEIVNTVDSSIPRRV